MLKRLGFTLSRLKRPSSPEAPMLDLFRTEVAVGLGLVLAGLSDSAASWLLELVSRTC
jgi:hypothetical protein